jgi:hypothetical protein
MNISKMIAYSFTFILVFAVMVKAWNAPLYQNDDSNNDQLQYNIRNVFKAVMQERNEPWNDNFNRMSYDRRFINRGANMQRRKKGYRFIDIPYDPL